MIAVRNNREINTTISSTPDFCLKLFGYNCICKHVRNLDIHTHFNEILCVRMYNVSSRNTGAGTQT
jgi:hypothetical protein